MKTIFSIFCIVFFACTNNDSFSVPLNGTYTIGTGGDYATINLAVSDVVSQGVSGPVVFNILTGIYTEGVLIDSINGSSSINTVTFKSQTNNHDDVILERGWGLNGVDHLTIQDVTFSRAFTASAIVISNFCDDVAILNNVFIKGPSANNSAFYVVTSSALNERINNLRIDENSFELTTWQIQLLPGIRSSNVRITNNTFIGGLITNLPALSIRVSNCESILIEKNIITTQFIGSGIVLENCSSFNISKNKFSGDLNALLLRSCGNSATQSIVSNNFMSVNLGAEIQNCVNFLFIYNSIKNSYIGLSVYSSFHIMLLNNLFIGPGPGNNYPTVNSNENESLSSDYNDFLSFNSYLIRHNLVDYNNVTDFYNATGLDQHSNSHPVNFVSPTDLHLAGLSIGDEQLVGIPSSIVTDDIDGQPRDPTYPYKGADEADVFLPVELSAFTSFVTANNVILNWTTSMEKNNSGFDIERSNVKGQTSDEWMKIGFIQGNGTTNSQNNYEFTDRNLFPAKYNYRLKQIDFNGNFEYYELSNEVVIGIPERYSLSQNYPNPFNPQTIISYEIPDEYAFIQLIVYDISGKEISTLVNERKEAGIYSVHFNGSNFSSGVYFYRLNAGGNIIDTKRMVLLK